MRPYVIPVLLSVLGLSPLRVLADQASEEQTVQVIVGGDVMAHERVKQTARQNGIAPESYFGSLIREIRPIVSGADIAFANLETPVSVSQPVQPRPFVFNAPEDLLKGLKWAGFGVLSVANNHALDQQVSGLGETIDAVRSEGLVPIGAGKNRDEAIRGSVFIVKGVRVGFLAFTSILNGDSRKALASRNPYLNLTERRRDLLDAVAAMKERADVILLSLHWGVEYETAPRKWQKDLAADLHARGVDVIIGHHPHVLQSAEWYKGKDGRNKLTLYSLGNLISNQSAFYSYERSPTDVGNARDSVLVKLQLSKNGVVNYSFYPLWIDNWKGPEEGIRTISISKERSNIENTITKLEPSPLKSFLISRQKMLAERYRKIYRTLFPWVHSPG